MTVPTTVIEAPVAAESPSEARESIKVQALLAAIGERMGLKVWLQRMTGQRFSMNGRAITTPCSTVSRSTTTVSPSRPWSGLTCYG